LNPISTTPPCYNNTTLGNHLYAQRKGPNVTKPICWNCKNCSYKCAAECWLWTLCHATQHGAVLIIFPLNRQTITITWMLSSGGEGGTLLYQLFCLLRITVQLRNAVRECQLDCTLPNNYTAQPMDVSKLLQRLYKLAVLFTTNWQQYVYFIMQSLCNYLSKRQQMTTNITDVINGHCHQTRQSFRRTSLPPGGKCWGSFWTKSILSLRSFSFSLAYFKPVIKNDNNTVTGKCHSILILKMFKHMLQLYEQNQLFCSFGAVFLESRFLLNEMKWKCNDFKCIQKPP